MIIRVSSKFVKQYRRLPERIKNKAKEKEIVFRQDPFNPRLQTHKLAGKNKNCWAFSITDAYRIKFSFLPRGEVLFLEIGPHDIYK